MNRAFAPLDRDGPHAVIVLSLIGHYERIAHYLAGEHGLSRHPDVTAVRRWRFKPRGAASLLRAALALAAFVLRHRGAMIGIPRSNSRALRLLVGLFPWTRCFSYSDGLGDSIHHFYLAGHRRYAGHVGFAFLSEPPLLHEIGIAECIEPWGRWITHDPAAPVLVIAKTPKETAYDAAHVARLYRRTVAALLRRGPVLVSGSVPGLVLPTGVGTLDSLMKRDAPLPLAGAVGLPSTAFLTLATRLPPESLHVMRLGCARTHPDADRRIRSMKRTLQRGMALLRPALAAPAPEA